METYCVKWVLFIPSKTIEMALVDKILKFHPFCAIKNFVVYEVATVKSFFNLAKRWKRLQMF